MKYAITLLVLALVAVGCASTSAPQFYRPANYAGAAWSISGTLDELNNMLTVTIDGAPAIQGQLSFWDGSGEITGQHQGKRVSASCIKTGVATAYYSNRKTVCTIFVENERAATLQF